MYDIWVAVIIGIVEGLTEFLPVSSTGHMILAQSLLRIPHEDEVLKTFEVVIQFGAILAVVVLYWRRLLRLIGIRDRSQPQPPGGGLNVAHIAIAIVPALGLAYLFRDFIKGVLFSPATVLIGLVLGGVFMIIAEKYRPERAIGDMDELTYRQAFFIGIAQILSLWPGFSRSGSTIAGGMLAGASRKAAADFTFLIALPVMAVASGYEMLTSYRFLTADLFAFFAAGFIVSFVVALVAIATFIKLVGQLKLTYFAYYRFVVAALFLLYMIYGDL